MHPRPNYIANENILPSGHEYGINLLSSQNSTEFTEANIYFPHQMVNYSNYPQPYIQNEPIHDNSPYEFPYNHDVNYYYPSHPSVLSMYNHDPYGHYNDPQPHSNYDQPYYEGERTQYPQFNTNYRQPIQYVRTEMPQVQYYHDPNVRGFTANAQHVYPQVQSHIQGYQSPNDSHRSQAYTQTPNFSHQQHQIAEKEPENLVIPSNIAKEFLDSSYAYADSSNYDEIKAFLGKIHMESKTAKVTDLPISPVDASRSAPCVVIHDEKVSKNSENDSPLIDSSAFEEMKVTRQEIVNMGICPVDPLDFEVFKKIQPHECNLEVPPSVQPVDNQSMPYSFNDLFHCITDVISMGISDVNISKPGKSKTSTYLNPSHRKATDIDYPVPSEYLIYKSIKDKMAKFDCKLFGDDLLLYIYYSSSENKMKMSAIAHLFFRNWRFNLVTKRWCKLPSNFNNCDHYMYFDPNKWEMVKADKIFNSNQLETESYQQYFEYQTNVVISHNDIINRNEQLIGEFPDNVLQLNPP